MKDGQFKRHSKYRGQGPSSYWMQEPGPVFEALNICPGQNILDMGCGAGDYTLQAARLTGPLGQVTAIDNWPTTVDALKTAAKAAGLSQIQCMTADITKPPLPIMQNAMDLCMAFTVLHIFGNENRKKSLFFEAARVLKSTGRLAVMECKKQEMAFGPPIEMRLSPEEVERLAVECGFVKIGYTDLGYNYLAMFRLPVIQEHPTHVINE
ncbi:class I SAM-dependent methyltransferase [uncultured Desulfobacter sp.]|uniref:class I SAM-dependent methyltransferase n=1 Tax=uncultured Desulfobacter sp. TaxID=240139 RepID=UPI0029F55302|nr:class I SAM-dependent methyltransferase [uncultured Desulfobacter sp.]